MSAAIKGTITTPPTITTWATIESGIVYHFFEPTVIEGLTMSPNMLDGTENPPTHQR